MFNWVSQKPNIKKRFTFSGRLYDLRWGWGLLYCKIIFVFFLPTMVNLKTLFICLSLTSFFELTYQLSANEVMKVELKCLLSHRSAENRHRVLFLRRYKRAIDQLQETVKILNENFRQNWFNSEVSADTNCVTHNEKIHKGYALNKLKTVSNLLEHPS